MMGASLPTSGAIHDAMTLLKVLDDPAAARALLKQMQEAASTYDAQLTSILARVKDVENREVQLATQEARLAAREAQLAGHEKLLDDEADELQQARTQHEADQAT